MLKTRLDIRKPDDLHKILEDTWLNIIVDETKIYNPILKIPEELEDKPHLYITWLMAQPEYFSFTCKELLGIEILPFQGVILQELWNRKFPMLIASRGASKSFSMALYAILRMMFLRGRKIIIAGSSFRQSKVIYSYMQAIYDASPILRNITKSTGKQAISKTPDEWVFRIGDSYAKCVPIGDGQKIRGQRAHDVLTDEFASIPIEIFETVLAGFGVVSSAPKENVKQRAREDFLKRIAEKHKIDIDEYKIMPDSSIKDNQIVVAGTAYYDFNHFSQYHSRWINIIKTRGDKNKLRALLGDNIDEHFSHSHYSVMRFPYNLLPKAFYDEGQIARSRSTMTADNFSREFGCIFSKDSNGFFRRMMLEACVVQPDESRTFPNGYVASSEEIFFEPKMFGDRNKEYIIAIDPASMIDNFAIVILELNKSYRKIVHVWTTNSKDHKERLKLGLTKEHNFYAFAARKIRELMRSFNTIRIAIDSEGGGREIMGQLKDHDKLKGNELPIYRLIDPKKPNPEEDGETGLHIIEEIHFSSAEWTTNANHGLKKDFEDRVLLFPYIDGISISLADFEEDDEDREDYDNLAQCIKDIEELKNELSNIIVTETPSGRERWDTPETKTATGKKGRMRKDRYSALLMANASARNLPNTTFTPLTFDAGGFAQPMFKKDEPSKLFIGPSWVTAKLQDLYG